jgi:hypothetical protein
VKSLLLRRLGMLLLLAGCAQVSAYQGGVVAAQARSEMVGLSREQVLSCMGPPQQQTAGEGSIEVWSYFSGGETQVRSGGSSTYLGSIVSGWSSSTQTERYCIVDVVMTQGRVSRVNYRGPTGTWYSGDSQCSYQVRNCLGMARTEPTPAETQPAATIPAIQTVPQTTDAAPQAVPQTPNTTSQTDSGCTWNPQKYRYDCL